MPERQTRIPLAAAIQALVSPDTWSALRHIVSGSSKDVLQCLSGHLTGRLLLTHEIASKSLGAPAEKTRHREFERLRARIIAILDERRRNGLELRGFTAASPSKSVEIPADLSLDYDFANGTARCGDILFQGVTAGMPISDSDAARTPILAPRVSDHDLETFCGEYVKGSSPAPSSDTLWRAAKERFPDKSVDRKRIRTFHSKLIPALDRKPGPRRGR